MLGCYSAEGSGMVIALVLLDIYIRSARCIAGICGKRPVRCRKSTVCISAFLLQAESSSELRFASLRRAGDVRRLSVFFIHSITLF